MRRLSLSLAAAFALVASAAPAIAQPALPDRLPPLLGAGVVRIDEGWAALAVVSEHRRVVELRREGETWSFPGTASLRVVVSGTPRERVDTLPAPPDSVMQQFLQALSQVPAAPGPLPEPDMATDSYAHARIRLEFGDGAVEFARHSGGGWMVTLIAGEARRILVTRGDEPGRALRMLDAYTSRGGLAELEAAPPSP
jgi:hypothetical protein